MLGSIGTDVEGAWAFVESYPKQLDFAISEALDEHINLFHDKCSRRIGHVLFSPPAEPKVIGDGDVWVPDYCLVRVDQFGRLDKPANLVYIDSLTGLDKGRLNKDAPQPGYFERPPDGLLELRGILGEGEIANPAVTNMRTGEPMLRVGKRGQATGLTWGVSTEVQSVVRMGQDGNKRESRQWTVLPLHGRAMGDFSGDGDSGALVWDLQGRIGGIIDAGSGCQDTGKHDVTYVSLMSWILADLRQYYYSVELLAT